ncbi:sugar phosphate isomerase/epimerase [Sphingobacterium sp. SRCM116780]|uniref:sugar phosphate isomerase/epimerase family protein n=1 Tax=Sphingobacterium sp. SRCM116780 TaxID=2907623 RepID=UPI001F290510|nr:sugar phosphate isomerase/epimerase [Sphingobacterium sp. SRCM116780]UIR55020.1 sugar phosphate isomerase/epimerase [Sphingobacterium sp. SRCM116780]
MMKLKFLVTALLITGTSLLGFKSLAQQKVKKKEIGLQLYSVKSLIHNDTDYFPVLKRLAGMGYTGVEAAGFNDGLFYNTSPQDFKSKVEKAGMKVISSHVTRTLTKEELASGDFSNALAWWEKAIDAHKAAGMKYIVTPWLEVPKTVKDLETQCKYLNEVGKLCRQKGIKYGYHNHAHEFQKVEDKVIMFDYMIEHTDPQNVFFEMDVYWTVIGKSSPVDYFNKYPGRFLALHIKDHREVGQSGMVGFDAIFKNAKKAGVQQIFVELEEVSGDLEVGLQQSIDYLKAASYVPASYAK